MHRIGQRDILLKDECERGSSGGCCRSGLSASLQRNGQGEPEAANRKRSTNTMEFFLITWISLHEYMD